MTGEELKQSILQMAIQGQLVPQDENDEPSWKLLERIKEEKERLIQEKKIKKEKPLPPISEEEKPFDIPANWEWVRLREISKIISKGTTPRGGNNVYSTEGIGFLRVENLGGYEKLNLANLKYVKETFNNTVLKRSILEDGDLLISIAGTLGRTGLVENKNLPLNTNQAVSFIRMVNKNEISIKYVMYVINSWYIQNFFFHQKRVTAIPNLTLEMISNISLALPPLEEQKRIVAKLEELQPLLDRYTQLEQKLSQLNKEFPKKLKESILQDAIQGKLTEQDFENDEPAWKLLERIKEEKEQLIQEKKIKKEKLLPPISEEEKPFEIPANWEWARLGNLATYKKGPFGSSLTKSMFIKKNTSSIKVYEQKNAIQKDFNLGEYYITQDYYEDKMRAFTVKPGDLIVSCAGTIGEIYELPKNSEVGIINQALMRISVSNYLDKNYYKLSLTYLLRTNSSLNSKGTAIKNIPSFQIMKSWLFPLPPLEEQKRIVAKLEELQLLIDKLNQKVTST